ncbi:hypothetical protein AG1IA_02962 [Rhizoctonia solani AG-1 IA]|uniref:Uncharacterized protein n=1 Tax=Thanatephorus cucumeris (strain AG1-IA) TaxID=983506 RepID=L8X304_THACA|nr:hypothetical protein AG1IA_02962 [Rhizoctonia solani AG-1 IA]
MSDANFLPLVCHKRPIGNKCDSNTPTSVTSALTLGKPRSGVTCSWPHFPDSTEPKREMYIPAVYKLLAPALSIFAPKPVLDNTVGEAMVSAGVQHRHVQSSALWDPCPKMLISCAKDGVWPQGILGNIGMKDFCREGWRCNQCE